MCDRRHYPDYKVSGTYVGNDGRIYLRNVYFEEKTHRDAFKRVTQLTQEGYDVTVETKRITYDQQKIPARRTA